MSVIIKELEIKNFRSCIDTKVILNNFSALIGYNNAGKSNLILAIKFLLEGTVKTFNYSSNANDLEQPIEVFGTFENVKEHFLELLDPDHANKLRPFILDEKLKFKRTTFVTDKQKIEVRLFDGETWKPIASGIEQSIIKIFPKFIHIEAMSDAQKDSTKNTSGTAISKLLELISLEIQEKYQQQFSTSLSSVSKLLSHDGAQRISALSKVDTGINDILNNFFPDISVKLHFPTPTIDDIFKNGTIKIFEDQNNERDFSNFGHGTQRSIQMALIRYLADVQQNNIASKRSNTIICIDEPELYLHPTTIELVRDALMTLSQSGFQILFSTHSASLLSPDHAVNAIQIFKIKELGTQARKPISEIITLLNKKYPSQFNDVFKLNNASQIFFSDEVLLVEGKTELRVIPNIYSKINNKPFHLKKLAIVSTDSKHSLIPIYKVLNSLGIGAKILTDLDFIGNCHDWDLIDEANKSSFEKLRQIIIANKNHSELQLSDEDIKSLSSLRQIAAKKFKIIAQLSEAQLIINNIHDSLKEKNIYIWKTGDIESIYGFTSKKENEWKKFNSSLINPESSIKDLVKNYEHLANMIEWIN